MYTDTFCPLWFTIAKITHKNVPSVPRLFRAEAAGSNRHVLLSYMSRVSVVSIATRLRAGRSGVWISVGARDFYLLSYRCDDDGDDDYKERCHLSQPRVISVYGRLVYNMFRPKSTSSVNTYVGWSFNSGTDFFVSEWIHLPASWSCLLQNSVLVLVCTYSSAPATDESTSGSHFL